MDKDYYLIIGVDRKATKAEVKKAFRRLAKKYHPDINDADDAEDRFKEISEAYEVLSDEDKRREYDHSDGAKDMYETGFDWNDFTKFSDVEDIFGAYTSPHEVYHGRAGYRAPQMGKDKLQDVFLTLEEAYKGTAKAVDVPTITECNSCHGSGAFPGTGVEMCPVCRGLGQVKQVSTRGYHRHVTIQSCMRCYGKGKIMGTPCDVCHGRGKISSEKRIDVKIPPGVHEGTSMRIPGEGQEGILGGRRGDLYVKVRVTPDERFEREGSDLITQANISFTQAALGGSVEVDTLNGRAKVAVPPGTQTHTLLRLKGKGMPRMEMPGNGDLLVRVVVRTPEKLRSRQRALFEEIAKDGGDAAVASDDVEGEKKGLFKRFKFFKKD